VDVRLLVCVVRVHGRVLCGGGCCALVRVCVCVCVCVCVDVFVCGCVDVRQVQEAMKLLCSGTSVLESLHNLTARIQQLEQSFQEETSAIRLVSPPLPSPPPLYPLSLPPPRQKFQLPPSPPALFPCLSYT